MGAHISTPFMHKKSHLSKKKNWPILWVHPLHAAAGFPTKPTLIALIKNKQFASWPGLTTKAVTKHFPESEETTKGHGRKIQSGLHSTKKTASNEIDNNYSKESNNPNPPPCPTKKTQEIYHQIYDLEDEAQLKMYTDQTGWFLKKSSRGHQYIMVLLE